MSHEIVIQELWNLDCGSELGHAAEGIPSLACASEPLTPELAEELAGRGLYVRLRDAHADLAIQRAGTLIHCAPSLERVVLGCVRDLLTLETSDEWHDVSHSEPRWPNLIFVSLCDWPKPSCMRRCT
jgi:hypothetical protein